MYSTKPHVVYGFHALDESVASDILNGRIKFKMSENSYDWLGNGIYFWENSLERAIQFGQEAQTRKSSSIKKPSVLGAVIELGNCLDLLDQKHLDKLRVAYTDLKKTLKENDIEMPKNRRFHKKDFDFQNRELDCAVILWACILAEENGTPYDSIRAGFWEGKKLYPNGAFREKNHIQIAVINPDCIKGIFLPREKEPIKSILKT